MHTMLTVLCPLDTRTEEGVNALRDLVADNKQMHDFFASGPVHTARIHILEDSTPAMGSEDQEFLDGCHLLFIAVVDGQAADLLDYFIAEHHDLTLRIFGCCQDFPRQNPLPSILFRRFVDQYTFDRGVNYSGIQRTVPQIMSALENQYVLSQLTRFAFYRSATVSDEELLSKYRALKAGVSERPWKRAL